MTLRVARMNDIDTGLPHRRYQVTIMAPIHIGADLRAGSREGDLMLMGRIQHEHARIRLHRAVDGLQVAQLRGARRRTVDDQQASLANCGSGTISRDLIP